MFCYKMYIGFQKCSMKKCVDFLNHQIGKISKTFRYKEMSSFSTIFCYKEILRFKKMLCNKEIRKFSLIFILVKVWYDSTSTF